MSPNTAQQSRPFVAKSDGTHCQVNSSNAFHVGQLCLPLPSILARRIHSLFPSILGNPHPHPQKCKNQIKLKVLGFMWIFLNLLKYKYTNIPISKNTLHPNFYDLFNEHQSIKWYEMKMGNFVCLVWAPYKAKNTLNMRFETHPLDSYCRLVPTWSFNSPIYIFLYK